MTRHAQRAVLLLALVTGVSPGCAEKPTPPDLIDEMGCTACHLGPPAATAMTERAPNLQDAGNRFRPAYLFEFLQHPDTVRRGIGSARMPDYRFSAREALALTLFLGERRQANSEVRAMPSGLGADVPTGTGDAAAELLITERYRCTACHTLDGRGATTASELRGAGSRLAENWIRPFLVDPDNAFRGFETMPSFFFQVDQAGGAYQALMSDALSDLRAIAEHLARDSDGTRTATERSYADARMQYPETSAGDGERLFLAQNCGACHGTLDGTAAPRTAPDLRLEAARVTRAWLEAYLAEPRPVRPSGSPVGSGARMPGFRLSVAEVRMLADQITDIEGAVTLPANPAPAPLSRFSTIKARRLIAEQLSCLGCHRLGGEGGKVGPDLSNLAGRLQPAFVERLLEEPHALIPETVMPQPGLAGSDAALVLAFLLQQRLPPDPPHYIALAEHEPVDETDMAAGGRLYHRYCAACHGRTGGGDGFNAEGLPQEPRDFTDAVYMSTRPDDTLFDGIAAGGKILGKSHRMPAWAATLSDSDIAALVGYLRVLCACEGPAWSRDGKVADPKRTETNLP